jgi:hypothetical protein
MTQDEVRAACATLEAQGRAVCLDTVHAHLGQGTRSQVRQHLTRMAEQTAREAMQAQAPVPAPRSRLVPAPAVDRATELANLDAEIAAQRGAGYGAQPIVSLQQEASDEDSRDDTKEAKRWRRHRALIQGLVDEAVPWLPRTGS